MLVPTPLAAAEADVAWLAVVVVMAAVDNWAQRNGQSLVEVLLLARWIAVHVHLRPVIVAHVAPPAAASAATQQVCAHEPWAVLVAWTGVSTQCGLVHSHAQAHPCPPPYRVVRDRDVGIFAVLALFFLLPLILRRPRLHHFGDFVQKVPHPQRHARELDHPQELVVLPRTKEQGVGAQAEAVEATRKCE